MLHVHAGAQKETKALSQTTVVSPATRLSMSTYLTIYVDSLTKDGIRQDHLLRNLVQRAMAPDPALRRPSFDDDNARP